MRSDGEYCGTETGEFYCCNDGSANSPLQSPSLVNIAAQEAGEEKDEPGKIKAAPEFIYLIKAENGLTKIGMATFPKKRLRELRTASPVRLELLHASEVDDAQTVESLLHREFKPKRSHGEWFCLSLEDIRLIQSRYPACPVPDHIRPGFHNLLAQIPDAIWDALSSDADRHGESIAKRLTTILAVKYGIPKTKIPPPRRTGRKPKKEKQ